jgi:hypothetical protein
MTRRLEVMDAAKDFLETYPAVRPFRGVTGGSFGIIIRSILLYQHQGITKWRSEYQPK